MEIKFTPKLYYGQDYEEAKNKVPVLIFEQEFYNYSKDKTYTLCLWQSPLWIKSIQPKTAIKTLKGQKANSGKPAPPNEADLLILKPGMKHVKKRWFWPESSVEIGSSKNRLEEYIIVKEVPITIEFETEFVDCASSFLDTVILNRVFDTGHLKAEAITFDFKILMNEEEENEDEKE